MLRKILLLAAGLSVATALVAPALTKLYVEDHYHVKVEKIRLGWPTIATGVTVERDSFHGELLEVRGNPWGSSPVEILGGTVHVIKKGHGKPQDAPGGRSIIVRGLRVLIEGEGFQANLEGVNLDSSYRFQSGTFTSDGRVVFLGSGGISKDLQTVNVDSAEVEVPLPFKIPRFPSKSLLWVENVVADRTKRSAEIGLLSYGPVTAEHVKVRQSLLGVTGFAQDITVYHPWIDVAPMTGRDVEFSMDPIGAVIHLGGAEVRIDPHNYRVAGTGTCSDWVKALPTERPEALRVPPENWDGNIAFDVGAKGQGDIKFTFNCKYKCSEDPIKAILSKVTPFRYEVYGSDGSRHERTVVKNDSLQWVYLKDLPPHISKAFITLEDPGFLGHRGIIVQALRNSLTDDLKLGEFFRGGSTITQQLAKNLWLNRHKTLSRKVYEALLAMALESCLTKEEILELYMNVVEFGPDLYGIAPAAKRYFDKDVADLLPDEAFFLAHTLPHPSKTLPPAQGGMENVHRLMKQLVLTGHIEDVYLPTDDSASSEEWKTNE